MSEEMISQDAGINADNLDDGGIQDDGSQDDWGQDDGNQDAPKAKSNVAKLLAERNALKKKLKDAEEKLGDQDFSEEKVQTMIEQAQLKAKQEAYLEADKNTLISEIGEEKLEDIEAIREQHPSLSYTEAAKLAGIEATEKSNPNRLSFSWNTPQGLKKQKSTNDLSDADLKQAAASDLKDMLWL